MTHYTLMQSYFPSETHNEFFPQSITEQFVNDLRTMNTHWKTATLGDDVRATIDGRRYVYPKGTPVDLKKINFLRHVYYEAVLGTRPLTAEEHMRLHSLKDRARDLTSGEAAGVVGLRNLGKEAPGRINELPYHGVGTRIASFLGADVPPEGDPHGRMTKSSLAQMRREVRELETPRIAGTRRSKMVCKKQTLKKYRTRHSPPYSAATCIGKTRKGNDGKLYTSTTNSKWVKS